MGKRKQQEAVEAQQSADAQTLDEQYVEQNKTQTKRKREPKPSTTTIVCVDCGAERTCKVQDAFQVRRCVDCQAKFRKAQRKQYRKNRIAKLQARIAELEGQQVSA